MNIFPRLQARIFVLMGQKMAVDIETYRHQQDINYYSAALYELEKQEELTLPLNTVSGGFNRALNDTNEYGVVLPPPIADCLGEECNSKRDATECQLTKHHLHSTEPDYVNDGKLAERFRNLAILTVWLPECAHKEHHGEYQIHVPIPHPKVMRQAKYESSKIRDIIGNFRNLNSNERLLSEGPTEKGVRGLTRARARLLEDREQLIYEINEIKVIPEELVVGALLLAVPDYAHSRIAQGAGYVLPGILTKQEIPIVLSNAEHIFAEAA